jgi:hypothetical protein
MFYIYQIKVNGVHTYVGRTKDLDTRTSQHLFTCYNNSLSNKQFNKEFYIYFRSFFPNKELGKQNLVLEPIYQTKSLADSKRFECLQILLDYFGLKNLKQKCPNISDR